MTNGLLDELIGRITAMPDADRAELAHLAMRDSGHMPWIPTPGPQTEAYLSEADELFYGGSAGGGKTDLIAGLALTAHRKSLILRRERDQVKSVFDRIGGIIGTDQGRNLSELVWNVEVDGIPRHIQCGGVQLERDKEKRKGRDNDLFAFDEIPDFTRSQYEFIKTWNRSAVPGQRSRVVCTGNPPTTAEGLWVIEYWAAWLDPKHPNPAKEGELRWYTTTKDGKQHEVDGRGPHVFEYEDGSSESILAKSRTFIRARLSDNPYLMKTDYGAALDSMPAELRAAYRDGRFDLGLQDNQRQVIPTAWILAAQARWKPKPPENVPMCAIGVDVAQGGKDTTTLAPRHDGWYAPLVVVPGKDTPDGKSVIAQLIPIRRNNALPIIDMGGGYGGSTKELLDDNDIRVVAYKGALKSMARSRCGSFGFYNKRAEAYWRFREALDPDQPGGSMICLPDDPKLVADLTAPTFEVRRGSNNKLEIQITTKEDLVESLGRSPDRGDAVVMAWTDGDKADSCATLWHSRSKNGGMQTTANMGHSHQRRRR